jgi:alpha-D-ribose 1-methylphosphonate 5-triphosphate synthase subunit PhnI
VKSLEEKILADVNAGMTLDQIVADVGKSVTGDALQIVYDYVASLLDSALLSDTQRASLGAMKVEAVQKIAMRSGSRVIDSVTK